MDDAARAARLVRADRPLLVEHRDARAGASRLELPGDGETEDARADDRDVEA